MRSRLQSYVLLGEDPRSSPGACARPPAPRPATGGGRVREEGAGTPGVLLAGELALWQPDIVAKLR